MKASEILTDEELQDLVKYMLKPRKERKVTTTTNGNDEVIKVVEEVKDIQPNSNIFSQLVNGNLTDERAKAELKLTEAKVEAMKGDDAEADEILNKWGVNRG